MGFDKVTLQLNYWVMKHDFLKCIYMVFWYGFFKCVNLLKPKAFQVALVVKNMPANAGDVRDTGSIPGSGRSPGVGHCNPFQYSCLENPDRGAWWATVHGVAESDTAEWLNTHKAYALKVLQKLEPCPSSHLEYLTVSCVFSVLLDVSQTEVNVWYWQNTQLWDRKCMSHPQFPAYVWVQISHLTSS